MFCPKCGAEYTTDATECVDCLVPLVQQPVARKPPPGDPGVELVTVFESANPALIALAKSLLDSAEIEFATKGDAVQDLFGWGRFPGGVNLLTGPVAFMVRAEDAKEAGSLLTDLQQPEQGEHRESD